MSGSAVGTAEKSKSHKYQGLVGNFLFQPVAYETTGFCGPSTGIFVKELDKKLTVEMGEPLETVWFRQKIS